jgi:hypothetical protein
VEKKPRDVDKARCLNYEELGHFTKDYEKVKQDWAQWGFITKVNVTTLGPNLIMFRFKVRTNGIVRGFFSSL